MIPKDLRETAVISAAIALSGGGTGIMLTSDMATPARESMVRMMGPSAAAEMMPMLVIIAAAAWMLTLLAAHIDKDEGEGKAAWKAAALSILAPTAGIIEIAQKLPMGLAMPLGREGWLWAAAISTALLMMMASWSAIMALALKKEHQEEQAVEEQAREKMPQKMPEEVLAERARESQHELRELLRNLPTEDPQRPKVVQALAETEATLEAWDRRPVEQRDTQEVICLAEERSKALARHIPERTAR